MIGVFAVCLLCLSGYVGGVEHQFLKGNWNVIHHHRYAASGGSALFLYLENPSSCGDSCIAGRSIGYHNENRNGQGHVCAGCAFRKNPLKEFRIWVAYGDVVSDTESVFWPLENGLTERVVQRKLSRFLLQNWYPFFRSTGWNIAEGFRVYSDVVRGSDAKILDIKNQLNSQLSFGVARDAGCQFRINTKPCSLGLKRRLSGEVVLVGDSPKANNRRSRSYYTPEHYPRRPVSHFILGSQIILGALGVAFGGYSAFNAFKNSRSLLEALLKFGAGVLLCAFGLIICGVGIELALG